MENVTAGEHRAILNGSATSAGAGQESRAQLAASHSLSCTVARTFQRLRFSPLIASVEDFQRDKLISTLQQPETRVLQTLRNCFSSTIIYCG